MIDYGYGVELHPLDYDHADEYRVIRNMPEIRKWCRQYKLISVMDQDAWFEAQNDDPIIEMFEVKGQEPTVWVGVCGLTDINLQARRAEFSLYIKPEEQGYGFGLAALRSLFTWGFDELNLNRIWGEVFDDNPAYNIFTKKLGMVHEGTRKDFYYVGGRYIDCHLVSCNRGEFSNSFPAEAHRENSE